jgi:N-acetylglucosamine kinase-like BadF-type ATPase
VAEPSAAVLAIDGGNSKTDVALIAADGTVLASVRGPGASQEDLGIEGAMRALERLVRSVGPASGPVATHTSACLAGADLPSDEEALAAAVRDRGWSATSRVLNDTFAVLRTGAPWGVAVVCGAGINCTGVAPDGRVARFLAFNRITGDWGGGRELSTLVMWHAMRDEDGRGGPTALRPAAAEYFGVPSVADAAIAIRAGQIDHESVLGLTTVLFDAASAGDPVAVELLERQGEEVCLMVLTVLRRLGLNGAEPVPVVLGGGLLRARNPVLMEAISRRLALAAPGVLPRVADAPPIAGAALLGLDHLGFAASSAERRLRDSFGNSVARLVLTPVIPNSATEGYACLSAVLPRSSLWCAGTRSRWPRTSRGSRSRRSSRTWSRST